MYTIHEVLAPECGSCGPQIGGGQTRYQVERELRRIGAIGPNDKAPRMPRFGRVVYISRPIAAGPSYLVKVR